MGWLTRGLGNIKSGVGYVLDPVRTLTGALKGSKGRGPRDTGQDALIREGFGAADATNAQALADLPKNTDLAKKALGAGRTNAVRAATERGQQDLADTQQSLAGRGLTNTTIYDNARQGVGAGVSRAVSDIDALYAREFGQLDLAEGSERRRLLGNRGQLQIGRGQALAGQMNHQQALKMQFDMAQNSDEWLNALFQIGGTAAGAYIGKKL